MQSVAQQARTSPRLRQNHNFHQPSERVQRFLNVLQPGTYVRPHCHRRPDGVNGFEFFLVLQGDLGLLILNEQGEIIQTERVQAQGDLRGIELPANTYHTLVAIAPDTTILELKEGPYNPTTDKDFLPMFPQEGDPQVQHWLSRWEGYFNPKPINFNL
jgi:cupin fold WbuC family metalloprotein